MDNIILPEIWMQIILYLDYNSIKNLCKAKEYIKHLCKINRKLLVDKFLVNSFDTSSFTDDELEYYQQIRSLEQRMRFKSHPNLCLNYNNHLFVFNGESLTVHDNHHKTIYVNDRKITLSNDGVVRIDDRILNINSIVINIIKNNDIIYIITIKKELYIWDTQYLYSISTPFNIKQCVGQLYLTDKGKLYVVRRDNDEDGYILGMQCNMETKESTPLIFYKMNNLSNIVKILSYDMVIDKNGDVFIYESIDSCFKLLEKYKNVIQMERYFFGSVFLYEDHGLYYYDNKGKIKLEFGELNANVTEFLYYQGIIYALNDEMKLYVFENNKLYRTYDLLSF